MSISSEATISKLEWTLVAASALPAHKLVWDELYDRLGVPGVLSADFVSTCLKWFSQGDEMLVFARTQNSVVLACVLSRRRLSWTTFQPSQAPMGAWLSDPAYCRGSLMREITRKLGVFCGSVTQLDSNYHAREVGLAEVRVDPYIETARLVVDQPWETYWNSRSRHVKQNHRTAVNRLRKANLEFEFGVVTAPAAMEKVVQSYADLESAGWKSERGTALTRTNSQGRFYTDLMTNFAAIGHARAYWMKIGGEVAAVDLTIRSKRCLIGLKTTYAEPFAKFSPAALLREYYFKEQFDQGQIDSIEFYGRAIGWQRQWSNDIRELYHMTVFRSPRLRVASEISRGFRQRFQTARHRVRATTRQIGAGGVK